MYVERFVLVLTVVVLAFGDEYLEEMQQRCYKTKKTFACAKYNVFDAIDKYNVDNVNITNDSTVRLTRMSAVEEYEKKNETIFPRARHLNGDDEFSKISKFFTRQAGKFFTEHGLVVELPREAIIKEEGRELDVTGRKKKKKALILPILILFKLLKVKILVALSLVGIFFIKKTILIAAFFVPSLIASIKQHCKMPHQYHVVPYHTEEDQYHHDHEHHEVGPSDYGSSGWRKSIITEVVPDYR